MFFKSHIILEIKYVIKIYDNVIKVKVKEIRTFMKIL